MPFKILIVDDEQMIFDGLRASLHFMRKEWKCYFARNSVEAEKYLMKEKLDVVVAEMAMPGRDGIAFFHEVEERQPGAVRIVLSGQSNIQKAMQASTVAHQFISKPCSTQVFVETIQRTLALRHVLLDDSVRAMVNRVNSLPVVPDLYLAITQELRTDEPNIRRIAALVEQDVGMTATLMKVVNSSFFGFYEKVTSPERAVILLGIDVLKGLVLGTRLLQEFRSPCYFGFSIHKLWEHCFQTGMFARAIATDCCPGRSFADACFISGMLHDVGKLVLLSLPDDMYLPIIESVQQKGGPVVTAEEDMLHLNHAHIGAYLLGLWGFPIEVVNGVYGHHRPVMLTDEIPVEVVVHIANALQHEMVPNKKYSFSKLDMPLLQLNGLDSQLEHWRTVCETHMR